VLSARKGSVKPEVVIVDNDVRQARDLQTVLKSANYSPETAETAAEGFELAVSQMNCELFILNAESPGWTLPMTLANLRADARTRNTPIVVIGPQRFASRMAALGEIYPGTWFVPEPVGKDSLNIHLEMLNLPGIVLTPADRAVLKKLAE
jgi:CheY-like chemotaxis protein